MKISKLVLASMAVLAVLAIPAMALGADPVILMDSAHVDVAAAMGMMGIPLNARARGLIGARLDASDATKVLTELKTTFEAFKEANNKELADLKKGLGDVVQSEKVDRINAEVETLQKSIDQINQAIAAAQLGGGDVEDPDKKAYSNAFDKFFRRGAEAGLQDLAVKAAASSSSDPDGGYTVPDQMEQTIDRVLTTVSAMRRISRVVNISTSVYKKLVNQGGAGSGWVGEKSSRPQTDTPTLSELSFPTMELYANPAATQNLLDDSAVDIAAWLADEVNIEFAEQEGTAFISGNGVNKPRGILDYDTVADASYVWGKLGFIATGVAADIVDSTHNGVDALTDLVYALRQGYRQNASFLMNRKLQAAVRKLKTIGDTEGYLWQPSVQAGQPSTLLGYPLVDDDNMSDVGSNAFPIAFGDFSRGYLIVDRQGIRVLRDPFTAKPYVLFYTTKRVGGGVQNFEAIKLLKCA